VNQILQYINQAAVMISVAFAAVLAATPSDHPLPWWIPVAYAAFNAVVHSLPAPTGSALPPQVKVPVWLVAALFGGSMALSGCSGASSVSPQTGLFNAEAALTAAANLDVAYRKLPACSATQSAPCYDPATQTKIATGLVSAQAAMTAAEKTVLGCDLATYVASQQTPPTAACGAPADVTTAAGAVAAAQNAIDAAKAIIPLTQ